MENLIMSTILFWGLMSWSAQTANVNKQGVILDGYDPVSYFKDGGPKIGKQKFQTQQHGIVYWFTSEENKQDFIKSPAKFAPQFEGWCAYAVADSQSKVEADPKSFLIQDGRLLVFYNGLWGDTRARWIHSDNKDSKTFLKNADEYWPEVKKKNP